MKVTDHRFRGSVDVQDELVVFTADGELDDATYQTFAALAEAALTCAGPGTLVLDVTTLTSVAGRGLRVLSDFADRGLAGRGHIETRGATSMLYQQLSTAGLVEGLSIGRPMVSPALVRGLATVTGSGGTDTLLDAALSLVVTMAQAVIVGADGVSITLPRHGSYCTVAASNDVVLAMDHDQYDTGQGPCLDAARYGECFEVDALDVERRWAEFIPRATARGIQSILSSPLLSAQAAFGALNIYSRTVGVFDHRERQWAHQFAAEASRVLDTARSLSPTQELQGQVDQALRSRQVIAQAQGLVMHRDRIGADEAFTVLREASATSSRPMVDECEALLDAVSSVGGATGQSGRP